jgi:hypothetical protein
MYIHLSNITPDESIRHLAEAIRLIHHIKYGKKAQFKEFCLLGHNIMHSTESQPAFWRNMSPWLKRKPTKKQHEAGSKQSFTSCKMSLDFQWTTMLYIREERIIHHHCCENFKSYIDSFNLV